MQNNLHVCDRMILKRFSDNFARGEVLKLYSSGKAVIVSKLYISCVW